MSATLGLAVGLTDVKTYTAQDYFATEALVQCRSWNPALGESPPHQTHTCQQSHHPHTNVALRYETPKVTMILTHPTLQDASFSLPLSRVATHMRRVFPTDGHLPPHGGVFRSRQSKAAVPRSWEVPPLFAGRGSPFCCPKQSPCLFIDH
jgi:hypothetical protein